jgi:hypothetical protein
VFPLPDPQAFNDRASGFRVRAQARLGMTAWGCVWVDGLVKEKALPLWGSALGNTGYFVSF